MLTRAVASGRAGVGHHVAAVAGKEHRGGSVFIAEEDDDEGRVLTGRFWASWQLEHRVPERACGLSAQEAIAWGRERADRVFIRLGVGDYYWAGIGAEPRGCPPWPPPDLPQLTRRRHPDHAYVDRKRDDPEIEWEVTLWVGADRPADAAGGVCDWAGIGTDAIAAIAERAGATWDSDARDQLIADRDRARRVGNAYFYTVGGAAYRLRLRVSASTQSLACERAASRVELPPALRLKEVSAVPSQRSQR